MLHNHALGGPDTSWEKTGSATEGKMTAASLGFDIFALTTSTINKLAKVERFHKAKLAVFNSLSGASGRVFAHVETFFADAVVSSVDQKFEKIAQSAIFFERAKDLIVEKMALTASNPNPSLLERIEQFEPINTELVAQCDKVLTKLCELNVLPQVAEAFERVRIVALRVGDTLGQIKEIITQGAAHAEVLACSKMLNTDIDHKLSTYLDDVEFDPELVALAGAAIERINATSKTSKRRLEV
jgi:hypothetical protein